jgi:hypothetical protein
MGDHDVVADFDCVHFILRLGRPGVARIGAGVKPRARKAATMTRMCARGFDRPGRGRYWIAADGRNMTGKD